MVEGITFDDVLLIPSYSEVLPSEVDVSTLFTRNVSMNIPVVSAAMDTVTEYEMAIAMAQAGGIGVIHRNLPPEVQAEHVKKVKRFRSWMVTKPYTAHPHDRVEHILRLMDKYGVSGLPVVNHDGKLVGLITARDLWFASKDDVVGDLMTPIERLVVAKDFITLEEAKSFFKKYKVEKLPIVDDEGRLVGMITAKDVLSMDSEEEANLDSHGRLRVAAAVGTGSDLPERVPLLVEAGVDVIVVDTAHGHSKRVGDAIVYIKENYPGVDVLAGNVATYEGAKYLIEKGADGVKVGVGPGSICTTRVVAGVGVPQLTAIMECARACREAGVPLVADGGIRYSGDVVKALAAGAQSVMIGGLLAGTDESPGEDVFYNGRKYKEYRGMGSLGAMEDGGGLRYGYSRRDKFIPEGVEGLVPYKGKVRDVLFQVVGGLRAGMGYVGAKDINELQQKAKFMRVSGASVQESHPHDVLITKEAPNYRKGGMV